MTRMASMVWGLTGAIATTLSICAVGCSSSGDGGGAPAPSGGDADGGHPESGLVPFEDAAAGHTPVACTVNVGLINDECTSCAQANCCNEVVACFSDPACTTFEVCLNNCGADGGAAGGDDGGGAKACGQACADKTSQATLDKHNAWAPNCISVKCASHCGL